MSRHLAGVEHVHVDVDIDDVGKAGKSSDLAADVRRQAADIVNGDRLAVRAIEEILLEWIDVANAGHRDVLPRECRVETDEQPMPRQAHAGSDGHVHAAEHSAQRRFRRAEIRVRVDVDQTDAPRPDANAALTSALGALDRSARGGVRRAAGEPLVLHRGPTTGNVYQHADARVFARSERLRFEMDAASGDSLSGSLLTRTGTRLTIPVPTSERMDGEKRILLADLTLAPLGAGDYVVELTITTGSEHRTVLTAIRVTQ